MTLIEGAEALKLRTVSSAELTEQSLQTIKRLNPSLNAYITVTEDQARKESREADVEIAQDNYRGPLHGQPFALKDVFSTRGIRTTCGSLLFKDHIPTKNSAVTERFTQAGAVLTGKTGLHELAYGITSNNPHFGTIRNPRGQDRIPGGSSGGSAAAVASGMVPAAMGSDTGGSIRIPAAFCGIVGLKPTSGRVSRFGVVPLDFTLDHMGPLTRTVRDSAVVLDAIAGYDPRDDSSSRRPVSSYVPGPEPSVRGLRIGKPDNFYFEKVEADVRVSLEKCFHLAEALGAEIVPIQVPDIGAMNAVARIILMSEASALLEPYLDRRDLFGADVLTLFDQGRLLSATDYINAQRLRRIILRDYAQIWKRIDVLFTPTSPICAPKIGASVVTIDNEEEDTRMAATRFVRGFNLTGWPALSLPCGRNYDNMPIGLQIIGKAFDEATVLQVGAAIEAEISRN